MQLEANNGSPQIVGRQLLFLSFFVLLFTIVHPDLSSHDYIYFKKEKKDDKCSFDI